MTLFEFYSCLRKEVLEQISGVENSNGYLSWDDTTPNYLTKIRLESLLQKYILLAKDFGVYVVTRYSSCSNAKHEGYPTESRYGLPISYQEPGFIWEGDQLFQGRRVSTCPCSPKNKPNSNWVIDDFVYKETTNIDECRRIAHILEDISEAIEKAEDKKPRSGIREHLLRAILEINDAILPLPIDEYIAIIHRQNS
ncbi:hypothetical protein D9M69_388250 [compost metagenome]